MKEMRLILVSIFLVLGFVGFVFAESNDSNASLEVVSIEDMEVAVEDVVIENSEDEVIVEDVEIEEDDLTYVEDLDVVLGDLVINEKTSYFNKAVSYIKKGHNKLEEIDKNLDLIIFVVIWVLLLFLHSIFFDHSSSRACLSKAVSLHRRAERAHVNGDYEKAEKLYNKSYLFREKGWRIASGGDDDEEI